MARLEVKVTDTVTPALKTAPARLRQAINGVVQAIGERAFQRIKFATPRDTGNAARGWRKTVTGNGQTVEIRNDVPYIRVLEFGGYPTNAPGQFPPKARTQRAPAGAPTMRSNVSRQAPQGMVRKTLQAIEPEFQFELEEAIDRTLNEDG